MKKILLTAFVATSFTLFSQTDKIWSLGAQWGFQGNHSMLVGGMKTANARFHHTSFGGGALNLIGRYDHNKHWMLMTGLGFNTFGFEFALAENYSLVKGKRSYSPIRAEFGTLEIPTLVYYKFNPNCKNSKWVVGAGFVHTLVGAQTVTANKTYDVEGNTNATYLKGEASAKGGLTCMVRFAVGREKLFKRGNVLNASFVMNAGLKELAKAKVNYAVDGAEYEHEFSNRGNFIGFRLAYFFKPFTR